MKQMAYVCTDPSHSPCKVSEGLLQRAEIEADDHLITKHMR